MGNIDPNAEIMPKQPNILKEEYGPAKDNLPIFSRPVESGYIGINTLLYVKGFREPR